MTVVPSLILMSPNFGMIKINAFIFLAVFSLKVLCQTSPNTTLLSTAGEKINRLLALNNSPTPEEIDLHINSNFLISGERLFISAFCLKDGTKEISDLSKIAYIEIIDQNLQPILQQKISLVEGRGYADFFISSNISSGSYKIVAYTQWMKNQGVGSFFKSDLIIVNPFKSIKRENAISDFRPNSDSLAPNSKNIASKLPVQIVLNIDKENLLFDLKINDSELDKKYFFLIHNNGRLKKYLNFTANQNNQTFSFNRAELPNGRLIASVMDLNGNLVGEKHFYHNPCLNDSIMISLDKNQFAPREKVSLSLFEIPEKSTLSISVNKVDSQIKIDSLSQSLNSKYEIKSDNYLWDSIASSKIRFLPEYRYDLISGIIKNHSGEILKNIIVELSFSGHFYRTRSNEQGVFNFEVAHQAPSNKYVINAPYNGDNEYEIHLFDEFFTGYEADEFHFTPFHLDSSYRGFIEKRSLHIQLENGFFEAKKDSLIRKANPPFYGDALVTYYLDEYTRFTKMEDVLREYVPQVAVRKNENQYSFRLMQVSEGLYLPPNPLLLVDGFPVKNANEIIEIDPLKIEKIEILNRIYYYGNLTFNGIVSLFSFKKELQELDLVNNLNTHQIMGISPKKLYYHPQYSLENNLNRIPDFRNQLYWNPILMTKPGIKTTIDFYTSDVTGLFEVDLRGISESGQVFNLKETFVVK